MAKELKPKTAKQEAEHTRDLVDLRRYILALPQHQLMDLVLDMYWKDQTIKESELYRAMIVRREHDVVIVPTKRKPKFSYVPKKERAL